MRICTPPAVLLILLCSLTQAFCSDEWPQFRGPEGNGVVRNVTLPLTWSESEHIAWKVPVEGEGFSSPVITDNEIWLTTAIVEPLSEEEEQAKLATLTTNPRGIKIGGPLTLKAVCYDAVTGEKKIDQVCFQFPVASPKHSTNSYASPSPIASGDFIYCHFGDYGTCCINRQDGKVVWKNQELHADHQNGPGSSPVLWGDFLICPFDGIDNQYIAAFDIHTGKIAWKTDRSGDLDPKPEFQKAYCTPTMVDVNGKPQVISPGANWVYGYDPSTGKELWRAGYGELGFSTVPKPVVADGVAFVCTSFMASKLLAVRYDGAGDVSATHIKWTSDRQIPKKTSLIFANGKIYAISDGGIAIALNAETGESLWQDRLRGQYSASPILNGDRIYISNQEGQTTVFKAGDSLEILAENQLDEGCMASPSVWKDSLILRTTSHLYRIAN